MMEEASGYLNLARKIEVRFPRKILEILNSIRQLSDVKGYNSFMVGGVVRDLILGVENLDVDIVVEGDAISLAKSLSRKLKGGLIQHKRFGTATVTAASNFKIDLATARKEFYERPGALPTVEFSSIKDDLFRRDFTINAMAIRLNGEGFGQLIDFFGGLRDLTGKKIQILHEASFLEDPTRILRAVRFEQRYDFNINRHTEELIRKAVSFDVFEKVKKQRIREEIMLLLSEKEPLKCVRRMDELHGLCFIHPKIRLTKELIGLFKAIDRQIGWFQDHLPRARALDKWLIYFSALISGLKFPELQGLCAKFAFRKGDARRILSYGRLSKEMLSLLNRKGFLKPSKIYSILEPLSYEAILLIMAKTKERRARRRIRAFLTKYNATRIKISGRDLQDLGLERGPHYKDILTRVLYERIDGRLSSKKDELKFVKRIMGRFRCGQSEY